MSTDATGLKSIGVAFCDLCHVESLQRLDAQITQLHVRWNQLVPIPDASDTMRCDADARRLAQLLGQLLRSLLFLRQNYQAECVTFEEAVQGKHAFKLTPGRPFSGLPGRASRTHHRRRPYPTFRV